MTAHSQSRRLAAGLLLIGLLAVALGWLWPRPSASPRAAAPTPAAAVHPAGSPKSPVSPSSTAADSAGARLLAADGSPREDLAALLDLVDALLQTVPVTQRPPLGFDTDLARALADPDLMGEAALPPTHPALRAGRLVDRWGSPWLVHPWSSDVIQLRSAGPDRRLFTADDLVAPPDPEA